MLAVHLLEDRLVPTQIVTPPTKLSPNYVLYASPSTDAAAFIRAIEYTDSYADDFNGPRRPTTVLTPTSVGPRVVLAPQGPTVYETYEPPVPPTNVVHTVTTDDMTSPLPTLMFEKLAADAANPGDHYLIARYRPDVGFCGNGYSPRAYLRSEGIVVNAAELERLKSLATRDISDFSDGASRVTNVQTGETTFHEKYQDTLSPW